MSQHSLLPTFIFNFFVFLEWVFFLSFLLLLCISFFPVGLWMPGNLVSTTFWFPSQGCLAGRYPTLFNCYFFCVILESHPFLYQPRAHCSIVKFFPLFLPITWGKGVTKGWILQYLTAKLKLLYQIRWVSELMIPEQGRNPCYTIMDLDSGAMLYSFAWLKWGIYLFLSKEGDILFWFASRINENEPMSFYWFAQDVS